MCPSCGSTLYSRSAKGVWRCHACSFTDAPFTTKRTPNYIRRGPEPTEEEALELERERLNRVFNRGLRQFKAYLASPGRRSLLPALDTMDELTQNIELARNPEPILRLKKLLEEEAARR